MEKYLNPLQKILYYFIYPACMYFSISIFTVTMFVYLTMNPAWAPSYTAMFSIWIFSLFMAGLGNIFRYNKLNMFFKILLHYIGTIIAFILIFLVAVSNYDNATGALLIVVVFTIIYFFIASIILLIRGYIKRSENKSERYKKQFNR